MASSVEPPVGIDAIKQYLKLDRKESGDKGKGLVILDFGYGKKTVVLRKLTFMESLSASLGFGNANFGNVMRCINDALEASVAIKNPKYAKESHAVNRANQFEGLLGNTDLLSKLAEKIRKYEASSFFHMKMDITKKGLILQDKDEMARVGKLYGQALSPPPLLTTPESLAGRATSGSPSPTTISPELLKKSMPADVPSSSIPDAPPLAPPLGPPPESLTVPVPPPPGPPPGPIGPGSPSSPTSSAPETVKRPPPAIPKYVLQQSILKQPTPPIEASPKAPAPAPTPASAPAPAPVVLLSEQVFNDRKKECEDALAEVRNTLDNLVKIPKIHADNFEVFSKRLGELTRKNDSEDFSILLKNINNLQSLVEAFPKKPKST